MPVPAAALTTKRVSRPVLLDLPYAPLEKKALPAGRPREWYVNHNRRLKAMRLAIALLDSGVHLPNQAKNTTIRSMAEEVGIHPPSDITCHMVRALMRYSR
ncbi:hypothetical protein ABZ791_10995 [Streptomyces huasconensis]|uniref:Uncharacterized protein n=1 Tax=Streptomyces huasconensis TaxID=1854574 RepID=A0ABV3LPI0_9ACTN|nr:MULTISPECIES: hypothetical protein [Streptomyces]UFQ15229.1 hypothetical protein J2N69_09545 [Streptomyces huasconensis]WCL84834.1 hypothetical protein PPN52_09555 [Streptomyces sp. JCM 35825]